MSKHSFKRIQASDLIGDRLLRIEDGNHGESRPRHGEFSSSGTCFVRAADIKGSVIDFASAEKISEPATRRISKGIGAPGDTLLTHKGTVGKVAFAPLDSPSYVCSPQTTFWRSLSSDLIDPHFLFYSLKSVDFQRQLTALKGESDMAPYVSLTQQRKLWLNIPHVNVQRAIAGVVSALDDKIAINQQIIELCDVSRQTAFDHFVVANPASVRECPLSAVGSFVNGRAFTKDATGSGRMVVRIAELNAGPGPSTVYNDLDVPDQNIARPGDVLFAWSGSLTVARWYRPEAIINQHIFKVTAHSGIPTWMIFELVSRQLAQFRRIAADRATTMGHIQRRHLDEFIRLPNREAVASLDASLGPLWDRALAAEEESLVLVRLRDTLLPLLMSGIIGIRGAEKLVGDAA
jgi:type I restriction enzyme, S subunit